MIFCIRLLSGQLHLFINLVKHNKLCYILLHTCYYSEARVKVPRGVLEDFVTSLECLAESPERQDAVMIIAQSLPHRSILTQP